MIEPIDPSACRDGTRRVGSAPSGSPLANTKVGHLELYVAPLPTPRSHRRQSKPYCHAAALTQSSLVGGPVRDPVLPPRDVMAAILV